MSFKKNKILIISILAFIFIVGSWVFFWINNPVFWYYKFNEINDFANTFNILGTLFSGLAFIGLIITILLQKEELKLQRAELELQRKEMQQTNIELKNQEEQMRRQANLMNLQQFETTFFNLLKFHKNDFNNVRITNIGIGRQGIENTLRAIYQAFDRDNHLIYQFIINQLLINVNIEEAKRFYHSLLNISMHIIRNEGTNVIHSKEYFSYVRDLLSVDEQVFLFLIAIHFYNLDKVNYYEPLVRTRVMLNQYDKIEIGNKYLETIIIQQCKEIDDSRPPLSNK